MTPEWRPLRGGSRCGRGKGRYEGPAPLRRETAVWPGGIDPGAEKSAQGERNGEALSATQCVALCRACRWRVRLEIGSLGTTSFLSPLLSLLVTPPVVLPNWKHSLAAGRPARKIARSARALDRRRVSLWRLAFARGGSCARRLPRLELLRLSRTGLMSRKPPQGYRDLHR